jgi:hypothetical protein
MVPFGAISKTLALVPSVTIGEGRLVQEKSPAAAGMGAAIKENPARIETTAIILNNLIDIFFICFMHSLKALPILIRTGKGNLPSFAQ